MTQSISHSACGQFDSLRDQLSNRRGSLSSSGSLGISSKRLVATATFLARTDLHPFDYAGDLSLPDPFRYHSCDDAVSRFQKFRFDHGLPRLPSPPAATARRAQRLPEDLTRDLVRRVGQIDPSTRPRPWLFHGRSVKIAEVRPCHAGYPGEPGGVSPRDSQKPGVGFPIARILLVFRLAVGTVLEAAWDRTRASKPANWPCSGRSSSVPTRRHRPGRPVLLLVPGDRGLPEPRRRRVVRSTSVAAGRLPTRPSAGSRRPSGHLGEARSTIPAWMSRSEYEAMPAE